MERIIYTTLAITFIVCSVQGARHNYWKRYKPEIIKYTPYAFNNYISFSPNDGWDQDSPYIKHVPNVRYKRTYMFYRGDYTPHINMYAVMASADSYKQRHISEDYRVCANYDANDNGDAMEVFACPNQWEPSNFTQCCGLDYAEFCCNEKAQSSNWVTIVAIVAALLAASIVVTVVVVVCLKNKKKRREEKNPLKLTATAVPLGLSQRQVPIGPSRDMPVEERVYATEKEQSLSKSGGSPFAYSTNQ